MQKKSIYTLAVIWFLAITAYAQEPTVRVYSEKLNTTSPLTRQFISPVRILWKKGNIKNGNQLLKPGIGQADLTKEISVFKNEASGEKASILLDFGKELWSDYNLGNVGKRFTRALPIAQFVFVSWSLIY